MKSLRNYIISTNERYNNEINVDGGSLIVNTEISERDHHYVNRIGTVWSVPLVYNTPIEPGDDVVVHHNVFRRWYDVRGNERNSSSYIDEDCYTVSPDQVFAYKRHDKWKAMPGYCFVKPLEDRRGVLGRRRELTGVLHYSNEMLSELGLKIGDTICFAPASEYEFNIDGEKLYRILIDDITIKLYEKEKVENNKGGGGSLSGVRKSSSSSYRSFGIRSRKSEDSCCGQEASYI